MRKKANDVKRGGWSAHRLADESAYAIDTKQKLKEGDVDDDDARITPGAETKAPPDAPHTSPFKTEASRKKSSTRRRTR